MTTQIDIRQPVDQLEKIFLSMPPMDCPVRHYFGDGIYMREVTMPADSFVIGHAQKFETLNFLVKGSGALINPDGTSVTVKAPFMWKAPPGRKLGYCAEESVLVNIYETDVRDVETLEATYLDKSDAFREHVAALESQQKALTYDNDDYRQMLAEMQVTEETARSISENDADLIPFPPGVYKIKIGKSLIEGKGVIATANIKAGEVIAPARIAGKRTPAGRYANHSATPNATIVAIGDHLTLVAMRDIQGCRGGLDGEEVTVNYRAAIATNIQETQPCQV